MDKKKYEGAEVIVVDEQEFKDVENYLLQVADELAESSEGKVTLIKLDEALAGVEQILDVEIGNTFVIFAVVDSVDGKQDTIGQTLLADWTLELKNRKQDN